MPVQDNITKDNTNERVTTSCGRGFDELLEYVIKYINEQQLPFDGLLIFSQGAA
ncbi:unnamed protein product, partial [Adineta steineri]